MLHEGYVYKYVITVHKQIAIFISKIYLEKV